MLAATLIAIFLIPVTFYVVETLRSAIRTLETSRFGTGRQPETEGEQALMRR